MSTTRHPNPDFYAGGLIAAPAWVGFRWSYQRDWEAVCSADRKAECEQLLTERCGRGPNTAVRRMGEGPPNYRPEMQAG